MIKQIQDNEITSQKIFTKHDILVISFFLLFGTAVSFLGNGQIKHNTLDVYFQADITRVYANMTNRLSNHYRTKVHPLFSMITHPTIHIMKFAGFNVPLTVRFFLSITTGIWLCSIFILFRLIGLHIQDSIIFSIVSASSAASIFWTIVPETYLLGSLTIVLVIGFSAIAPMKKISHHWFSIISAASLSVTITNWMVGIFSTFINNPWRQAFQISVNALMIITFFYSIQSQIYPSSQFFLGNQKKELKFMMHKDAGGMKEKLRVFFFHSVIMPKINVLKNCQTDKWPSLSVQYSKMGSTGISGFLAIIVWSILMITGVWAFFSTKNQIKFKSVLGLSIIGQLCLHLVYGEETFLYAMHWVPLLIILSSWSLFTSLRKYTIVLGIMLILTNTYNNIEQLNVVAMIINNN